MATITKLGFTIDSKYDPKGVAEAQAHVREFAEELRRISGKHIRAHIDAEVDPIFGPDFQARISAISIARDFHIPVRMELDDTAARAKMEEFINAHRTANVDVDANTAAARAHLDALARNRTARIDADSGSLLGTLAKIPLLARYATIAIAGIGTALYALGPASVLAGAAFTAALGGGVIAAGAAALMVNDKLTLSHQKAQVAAQQQAQTAQYTLGEAYRSVATTAADGANRITQAEHNAESATRSSKLARQSLTDAYRDAGREYEDMVLKLRGAPVDEKAADIAVRRAKQRLMELGKNGGSFNILDVEESRNNIDQALENLDEVRTRNRRLAEDAERMNQKGIEGSDKVVTAKNGVIDAEFNERESVISLQKARNDATEANRKAQEQVTQALSQVTEAQLALNEATRKSNSLASQAARMFSEMAAPLRGPLNSALERIKTRFEEMSPVITAMFSNAVPLIEPYADALTGFAQNIIPGVSSALKESLPIVLGFRDGLSMFGTHLGEMFTKMTAGAEGLGNTWRVFGDQLGRFFTIIGDAAGRMSNTGTESLTKLMGGFNDFFQKMVDGAVPAMESMAGGTSTLYALFSLIGDFFKYAGPGIGQFTEAISGVLQPVLESLGPAFGHAFGEFLTSLVPAIEAVTPIITDMANGFADLMKHLDTIMPVMGPFIASVWALDAALDANPISLIVIAVAALAGGITYLATKTEFFQGVWERIKPVIESVVGPVQQFGHMLMDVFGPKIHDIVDAAKGAFADLKDQWETSIKPAFAGLMETLGPLWEQLKPVLGAIGVAILAVGSGILGVVQHSIKPIMSFIGDTITNVINAIKGVVEVITGIIEIVKGFVEVVFNIGKGVWQLITGDWEGAKESFQGIINGITDIGNGFVTFLEGVGHIIGAIWDTAFSVVKNGIGLVIGVIRGFIDGVIGFFEHLYDVLVGHSIVPDLIDKIVALFKWLPDQVIKFIRFLVDEAIKLWDYLKTKWEESLQGWKIIFERISAILHELWGKFWNTIKDVASGIWDTIKTAFSNFADGVKSVLEGIVHKAEEIWNGIKGIFARPINFVIGIWNDHIADKIGLGDKKISKIEGFADGGPLTGKGGPREDRMLIAASPGEYMVNARAAFANRPLLDAINYGGMVPKFADGGPVGWMENWMKDHHPAMQVTSDYRNTPDYHGQGKAVDFASSLNEMMSTAMDIASQWGRGSLELIHGNGFKHNVKNGNDVGDGMGLYGAGTMAEHNSHVHWAVDKALDGNDSGGGLLDRIGGAVSSVVGGARELVSGIFEKLSNPILDGIPDPFISGMGGPMGSTPKSAATMVRNSVLDLIKGHESTSSSGGMGDLGGIIPDGDRLKIIEDALALTNTPPPDTKELWLKGMNTLIGRESGWNANAINNTDINARNGVPSQGLAQVIPPTFNANKVPGHDNILDPVSNVAASVNYIKGRYGSIANVQQANANMPPQGYGDGTDYAKPGWNLVGENGPEMVKFRGGEEVHSFDEIIARLQGVNVQQRGTEAVNSAVKANLDTFISDLTGGSIGEGALPQLFKQGIDYAGKLQAWNAGGAGETHYHVGNMDEALRAEKERQRLQALGYTDV